MPTEYAAHVYDVLRDAGQPHGIVDVGYRAIDTLRMEKGYVYWSTDVTPDTTPWEAGLEWRDRPGTRATSADALRSSPSATPASIAGCARSRSSSGHGATRSAARRSSLGGEVVGFTTRANFGHTIGKPIAYGYVPVEHRRPRPTGVIEVYGERDPGDAPRRRAVRPEASEVAGVSDELDAVARPRPVAARRRRRTARAARRADQPQLPDRRRTWCASRAPARASTSTAPTRRSRHASRPTAGVNAEVLFFDATDGLMVTRFVDGAVDDDARALPRRSRCRRPGGTDAAPAAHARRHRSPTSSACSTMIDEYKALLALEVGADASTGTTTCRPTPSSGERRCSPTPCRWRRATAIRCARTSSTRATRCTSSTTSTPATTTRCGTSATSRSRPGSAPSTTPCCWRRTSTGSPPAADAARMVIHKANCDLLWTLWGVIQHVNDNPVDDFWAYGVGRFERCRQLMASDEFKRAIATLGG